jgi:hypothetical protein
MEPVNIGKGAYMWQTNDTFVLYTTLKFVIISRTRPSTLTIHSLVT